MVLKNIAKLCKARGFLTLHDGEDEQWLGDGAAAYSMAGAPEMDADTAAYVLDLTEKELEKIELRHEIELPKGIDFSDIREGERGVATPTQRLTFGGQALLAVSTSEGVGLFNPDYLLPLKDLRDGLEWYERKTAGGIVYLVAATGWVPRAVILPMDVSKYQALPEELEALAAGLRRALDAAEEREQRAADGRQMTVDMETGEVLEG